MIKFDVCIKSGTSGHLDYDNCDSLLKADIQTEQIPSKGDYLAIEIDGRTKYLVTDVCRSFSKHGEFNTVYVIKA